MTVLATTTLVPAVRFSVDKEISLLVIRQNHFVPMASKCLGQTFRFAERPSRPCSYDDERVRRQFLQERFNGISTEIDVALQIHIAGWDGFGEMPDLIAGKVQWDRRIVERQWKWNDLRNNERDLGFKLRGHLDGSIQSRTRVTGICEQDVDSKPSGSGGLRIEQLNAAGSRSVRDGLKRNCR